MQGPDLSSYHLPVQEALPELLEALAKSRAAVLIAPPGAGKTTLVPLSLLDADWRNGRKIIVLEPRRLAARAAAERMSEMIGESTGETVGYRVRLETKVSSKTIIEVVTAGVFIRMLADESGLEDVACVIFDEFHERGLDSDLALALSLYLRENLREDLRLLPMSATLEGADVSELIGATLVESKGRSFPVSVEHRERPARAAIEPFMADSLINIIRERSMKGETILGFLPGQREIIKVAELLEIRLDETVEVHRLYGAASFNAQKAALKPPEPDMCKVVLASAIAETSLTIPAVTVVVDSGLAREPVFDVASGLTRLQTTRASKATIDQRAGRAGRLGPGRAVRLWREEQTKSLPPYPVPEILNADLTSLVLLLADWGISDTSELNWLDQPPDAAVTEARSILEKLGALESGRLTAHGRHMTKFPLEPRLAHMVIKSADFGAHNTAAQLALLVQDPGLGRRHVDISERLSSLQRSSSGSEKRSKLLAKRIAKLASQRNREAQADHLSDGVLLATAFPDRIAQRSGQSGSGSVRFRLANGRGGEIDPQEPLSKQEFIVVIDMIGRAGAARITSAASLTRKELLEHFSDQIEEVTDSHFEKTTGAIECTRSRKLGSIVLEKPVRVEANRESLPELLLDALRQTGLDVLPWGDASRNLLERLRFLRQCDADTWPDVSEEHLLDYLETWLLPFLGGKSGFAALNDGNLKDGLLLLVGYEREKDISRLAPEHYLAPSGTKQRIRYQDGKAVLAIRPQELFGLDAHPHIMAGEVPLEIELLSPAQRPIQITRDLPGFWRGSWSDVRADLRGSYPKHPWPEEPQNAEPTNRTKARR